MKRVFQETAIALLFGAGIMASFLFLGLRAKAAPVDNADLRTMPREELAEMRERADVPEIDQSELDLLAAIVYAEAGDQDFTGQRLVADCVMNRVRSGSFPNTVAEVIYQPGQFSPVTDGGLARAWGNVSGSCYEAARMALSGDHIDTNVLYFSMYYCANGAFAYQWGDHYFGY